VGATKGSCAIEIAVDTLDDRHHRAGSVGGVEIRQSLEGLSGRRQRRCNEYKSDADQFQ
jgi:hypothetical protein